MHSTDIVTSFILNQKKILILKRSQTVKTMKNMWSGISGVIENNEEPLVRAKIENRLTKGAHSLEIIVKDNLGNINKHNYDFFIK